MFIYLTKNELKEILEWCENVEQSDTPWRPQEIPLYIKIKRMIETFGITYAYNPLDEEEIMRRHDKFLEGGHHDKNTG